MIILKLRYTSRCTLVAVRLGLARNLPQSWARHANVNGFENRMEVGNSAKCKLQATLTDRKRNNKTIIQRHNKFKTARPFAKSKELQSRHTCQRICSTFYFAQPQHDNDIFSINN
jgi:hypothetical protein